MCSQSQFPSLFIYLSLFLFLFLSLSLIIHRMKSLFYLFLLFMGKYCIFCFDTHKMRLVIRLYQNDHFKIQGPTYWTINLVEYIFKKTSNDRCFCCCCCDKFIWGKLFYYPQTFKSGTMNSYFVNV